MYLFKHITLCLNIEYYVSTRTLCSNKDLKPHFPLFVQTKSYMFEQIYVFAWTYNSMFEHRVLCSNIKSFMFKHKTLCSNIELKTHFRMSSPGLRKLGRVNKNRKSDQRRRMHLRWVARQQVTLMMSRRFIGGLYGRAIGRVLIYVHGGIPTDPFWMWMDPGAMALIGAASFFAGVSRLTMSLTVIMVHIFLHHSVCAEKYIFHTCTYLRFVIVCH